MKTRWLAALAAVLGLLLVCVIFLIVGAGSAEANTLTVCASGCDYTHIQAAVDAANPGDTLLVLTGVYSENITIPISLTIQGEGSELTIIDGNGEVTYQRVITITSSAMVTITGVTITGGLTPGGNPGRPGGGIYNAGSLAMVDTRVQSNRTGKGGDGGGIFNAGILTMTMSIVSGNQAGRGSEMDGGAGGNGGGIYNTGSIHLEYSQVRANQSGNAGPGPNPGQSGQGGGIWNSGALETYQSTIDSNHAGAGEEDWSSYGTQGGHGGGIYSTGVMTITSSTVNANVAGTGGGGYLQGGPGGNGGGVMIDGGSATMVNSTLSANSSGGGGGGYYFDGWGGDGGGIYNQGVITFSNLTISLNQTGSGVLFGIGGGVYSLGTAQSKNTIIAGNSDIPDEYDYDHYSAHDCSGEITSLDYNLIGTTDGCTLITMTHDLVGTDDNLINARLDVLTDNGGETQTHALLPDSSAIDAGNPSPPGSGNGACEVLDQRGIARPLGSACDIGAYEATPTPLLAISKSGPLQGFPEQPVTYTLTITNQGSFTATQLVISDVVPLNASYVYGSGGTLQGDMVVWELAQLDARGGEAQVTFAITATQTITNLNYWVTAHGGYQAMGLQPVTTWIEYKRVYLPLVTSEP